MAITTWGTSPRCGAGTAGSGCLLNIKEMSSDDRDSDRTLIILSLLIGVIVGLTTVAFILVTGRLAARMYPPESAAWRRLLVPVLGSLVSGYLLFRFFPNARGSGIPGETGVLLHLSGERHCSGTRRSFGSDRGGDRVGNRTAFRP